MNPAFTIGNQMREVIRFHQKGAGNGIMDKLITALEEVHIPDPQRVLKQYPHQLSGGMLQRVMIAMALSCESEILICDEPSTALDVSTQAQIIKLLNEVRNEKETSLIFITHDLGVLASVCTSAAVMYAGSIVEYSDIETILLKPSHPYTQAPMGSTCRLDQDECALQVIQGQVPNLAQLPSGCKFHPRCVRAETICKSQAPILEEKEAGHWAACHLV
jgi:oligopeptide/dipeptide ABC transporter ATP-binding protein